LDKAGKSEKTPNISTPADDIPVAFRETLTPKPKPPRNRALMIGGLALLGIVALAAGSLVSLRMQQTQNAVLNRDNALASTDTSPKATPSPTATADALMGHFAYTEAPLAELAPIVDDGGIKMRKAAAKAYREMAAAAQQSGVTLVPISGFRSVEDQQHLYFDVKAERGQVASERAKVSAPPGYSEHHTGYAVDIGDAGVPVMNLNPDFDKTPVYRWLQANAARYSFELSFPKGNKQGVSYEPWHWRFVGDIQSLKTFYKAKEQK